jgi:hypothetical protein
MRSKLAKMKTFMQDGVVYDLIREDGRLERVCNHGVGHTVGHKDRSKLKDDSIWVHGCDGCCTHYKLMEPSK